MGLSSLANLRFAGEVAARSADGGDMSEANLRSKNNSVSSLRSHPLRLATRATSPVTLRVTGEDKPICDSPSPLWEVLAAG